MNNDNNFINNNIPNNINNQNQDNIVHDINIMIDNINNHMNLMNNNINIIMNQINNNNINLNRINVNHIIQGTELIRNYIQEFRNDDIGNELTLNIINWFSNLQSPSNNVENRHYSFIIMNIVLFNIGMNRHNNFWPQLFRDYIDNLYNIYY